MNKIHSIKSEEKNNAQTIVKVAKNASTDYMDLLKESKEKIIKIGANRVQKTKDGMTIMLHCHSSITTGILIQAKKQGKNFDVICTETRPRNQGRLTAK